MCGLGGWTSSNAELWGSGTGHSTEREVECVCVCECERGGGNGGGFQMSSIFCVLFLQSH